MVHKEAQRQLVAHSTAEPANWIARVLTWRLSLDLPSLAGWNLVNLGEVASSRPAREFVDCFLGEILPSGDVDSFEPALLAPSPRSAGRNAGVRQPLLQADNRPARPKS